MGLERYLVGAFPLFGLLIQTIIPLFLLVIAVVRRKENAKELNQYEEKNDGER